MRRFRRYAERVAMPVERHELPGQAFECGRIPGLGREPDRVPPDLFFLIFSHAGAKGFGDQLSPEADAQHDLACRDGLPDELFLSFEPGIYSLVVNAHGPAHDHQPVEVAQQRQLVFIRLHAGERVPVAFGPLLDVRRSFERRMLQR
jgi:hypothetical protein